jgi:hypothetical protein
MQIMQFAAYVSSLVLVACAASLPRVRFYVLARVALDALRLALASVDSASTALFFLDGVLLMTGPALLACALALPCLPFAAFGVVVGGIGARLVAASKGYELESLYGSALLTIHVAIVGSAAASQGWRRRVDLSSVVLIVLASSGIAGAVVALAWSHRWDAVNAGNVLTRAILCVLCLLSDGRQKPKK